MKSIEFLSEREVKRNAHSIASFYHAEKYSFKGETFPVINPLLNKEAYPEISVIITFHDQEQYVRDCLNSFLSQTIKVPYEIIAIVDASTDNTFSIIEKEFKDVIVYDVDYHGAQKSRNYGYKKSRGKFICHFDGDDFAYPEYLEKLYEALQRNPDKNISYSRFDFPFTGIEKHILPACNVFEWSESWMKYSSIVNTASMIRRELRDKVEWNELFDIYQDYDFTLSLLEAGGKGIHVRETLWNYRYTENSKWSSGKYSDEHKAAMKEIIEVQHKIKHVQAETTFVAVISREEVLDEFFESIEKIDMPREEIHFFAFLDTQNETLVKKVKQKMQKLNFLTSRMFVTNEQDMGKNFQSPDRELRISRNTQTILNDCLRARVSTEFIFMLEDDTIPTPDCYKKFLSQMKKNINLAYITGVEISKTKDKHIGLSHMKGDQHGDIYDRVSPFPKDFGVEKINAGGWYCWMGRPKFIVQQPFRVLIEPGRYVGPDYLMVYDLSARGFDTLVDWSVKCLHYDYNQKKWLDVYGARAWHYQYKKVIQCFTEPL